MNTINEKNNEKVPPVTEKIIQEAESSISEKNDKINNIFVFPPIILLGRDK